jgi:diacylglycerol kinase family enzyme
VRHFRARRLALDADGPLPIELDGDAAGTTPATITVAPGALRILTPQAA